MNKHLLLDDFDYDFFAIGITCHAKDYRLCWAVNKLLDINLEKDNDIELTNKKGKISKHSSYYYMDESSEKEYRLISNKSQNNFLVKEQKQADFYLLLYENTTEAIKEIITQLKTINIILMSFEVNITTLKSKENLLF
jgi:hypothetical protein